MELAKFLKFFSKTAREEGSLSIFSDGETLFSNNSWARHYAFSELFYVDRQ